MNKREKKFLEKVYANAFIEMEEWDPDKFNWKRASWVLCKFCNEWFDIWWDKDKFDYDSGSWTLAKYCYDYFDIWWNKEKYNYKIDGWFLSRYCFKYIHKWWDPEKFDKKFVNDILENCKYVMTEEMRNELSLVIIEKGLL